MPETKMTDSQMMKMLTDFYAHGNEFFKVKFRRRNDKIVAGKVIAPAGSVREMVCRLHVSKGVKGEQPPEKRREEDFRNRVLTVFEQGSSGGFKRIPLDDVIEYSPYSTDAKADAKEEVKDKYGEFKK